MGSVDLGSELVRRPLRPADSTSCYCTQLETGVPIRILSITLQKIPLECIIIFLFCWSFEKDRQNLASLACLSRCKLQLWEKGQSSGKTKILLLEYTLKKVSECVSRR